MKKEDWLGYTLSAISGGALGYYASKIWTPAIGYYRGHPYYKYPMLASLWEPLLIITGIAAGITIFYGLKRWMKSRKPG